MKAIQLFPLLLLSFFSSVSYAQTVVYPKYYPDKEIDKVKEEIDLLLKKKTTVYDKENDLNGKPENVMVFDDRIEFSIKDKRMVINMSDLIDYPIERKGCSEYRSDGSLRRYYYILDLGSFTFFNGNDYVAAEELADDLFFIQQKLKESSQAAREKKNASGLILFEPIAEQYRSLEVKPPMKEEQRKFIVQADFLYRQKDYDKAIELYNKAIEVDQTTCPAAYSNLALISAQIHKFDEAIFNMKKYLMLEPEAPDARIAQDKIYEWELIMQK